MPNAIKIDISLLSLLHRLLVLTWTVAMLGILLHRSFKSLLFQLLEGQWGAVRAVEAGQFHSAILNTKGEVWMFGWGVWGQLGMGGRQISDCVVPTKVPNLKWVHAPVIQRFRLYSRTPSDASLCSEPIKEVGCGRVHTVLLTVSGRVLVAGSGSYGQLGTNEEVRKQYDFRPLPVDPKLKVGRLLPCSSAHFL